MGKAKVFRFWIASFLPKLQFTREGLSVKWEEDWNEEKLSYKDEKGLDKKK